MDIKKKVLVAHCDDCGILCELNLVIFDDTTKKLLCKNCTPIVATEKQGEKHG